MGKSKTKNVRVDELSNFETRKQLRAICPCRTNSSEDIDGWRALFKKARFGSYSERKSAAHSIGTLIERAQDHETYRSLLQGLKSELDALMQHPRSASQLLGVMKGHGHQRKGAGRRNFRKAISVLNLQNPASLATWLNHHPSLVRQKPIDQHSKLVTKLAQWLKHRVEFQPGRKTSEDELLHQVRLLRPSLFQS